MRDGIFNHGPYPLGNGRCLLVKELTELRNEIFPWSNCVRGLPTAVVRGLVLRPVKTHFDVLGGVALQPVEADDRIELDGVFEVVDGELVGINQARAEEGMRPQAGSTLKNCVRSDFPSLWSISPRRVDPSFLP